ncbi:hypothetical protein [Halobellus rarus]|uniref:Gins51 C-terminal domain-containing protein n=1 Tax=Halobellus rarus TaxID=1126237 RepID=A0ABD6CP72_9EURY|nr:hypothetical protein [Halobellus rarus]
MNLDELRSVRRTERQKDSLQHLRDSFYEDVAAYIAERKAERQRAADAAEDPFADPEVGQLTDEIETAEEVVEAIYERRVGKVVKLASFAAADMSADTNGLTAEERELFEGLVARIKQNRRNVLDVLAGEGGDGTADEPSTGGESPAGTTAASTARDSPTATGEAPESPAGDRTDPDPISPDDVLADAMGGDDAPAADSSPSETSEASATEASPSDATNPPAGSTPETSAADAAGDDPSDVPPDAPPDATTPETPVIGEGGSDGDSGFDTDGRGEPRTDGAPGRVENGASGGTGGAADRPSTDRVTLRITEDVGAILGVDEREYDLESEDVVTLPTTNAGPLLERNAAERLD